MLSLGRLVPLAMVALVGLSGVARATDMISYTTTTNHDIPIAPETEGYNWSGFYAGIFGVDQYSPSGGNKLGLGALAGANLTFDYFLLGGEVAVQGLADGSSPMSYGQALGRVGVFATDNALVYASAGAGMNLGVADEQDFLLGGGLEYAVTDNVSLRAQYLHGFPVSGIDANAKDQVTLGASYHF